MSLHSSWRPAEDKMTMLKERTWLAGMILAAVAYGIIFILFILTFKQLIRTITKYNYGRRLIFIIYIAVMLIVGTLHMASIVKVNELSFIDYRFFPGPAAFGLLESSLPLRPLSTIPFVIANWLANGLLIYRYLVIFRSTYFPLWVVMLLPVLAYMAYFSISMVLIVQILVPASSPLKMAHSNINLVMAYIWMLFSLDISITIAICARLLFYRRRAANILGPNHGTEYANVAAILVESAFLSSAFTLLYIVLFTVKSPIQNIFSEVLGEVHIIATLLIIYRIAHGDAWGRETPQTIFGTREA